VFLVTTRIQGEGNTGPDPGAYPAEIGRGETMSRESFGLSLNCGGSVAAWFVAVWRPILQLSTITTGIFESILSATFITSPNSST
jgi:hypothetical protein